MPHTEDIHNVTENLQVVEPMEADASAVPVALLIEEANQEVMVEGDTSCSHGESEEETVPCHSILQEPTSPPIESRGGALDVLRELQTLAKTFYGTQEIRTPLPERPISKKEEEKDSAFDHEREQHFAAYVEGTKKSCEHDGFLFSFAPRCAPIPRALTTSDVLAHYLLPEVYGAYTTSLFIRWNGKGVVVNPGKDFLKNFHEAGFSIADIDHVIVSEEMREGYHEVIAIHALNYRVNVFASQVHLICYHLHPLAHRHLASRLRPAFKTEKSSVVALELYEDSPFMEMVALSGDIRLSYFIGEEHKEGEVPSAFGLRLELYAHKTDQEELAVPQVTVGLVSGDLGAVHHLATYLDKVSILVVDLGSMGSLEEGDGLTYLLEAIGVQLVLLGAPAKALGDCRLEFLAHFRRSCKEGSTMLPLSDRFSLNLKDKEVFCSLTGKSLMASEVKVGRPSSPFGPLLYLGPMSLA